MRKQIKTNPNSNPAMKWKQMLKESMGVQNEDRLNLMTEIAMSTARNLNENQMYAQQFANAFGAPRALNEAEVPGAGTGTGVPGGAYFNSTPGTVGGAYAPYQNVYNTVGIGNVVPAGQPALTGSDYADNSQMGSGDKLPAIFPISMKVAAKTIGFDLVHTTTLQGPSGTIPYLDYVYTGTKQPYGATPGYDLDNQNPNHFHDLDNPNQLYGLPHAFKADLVLPNGVASMTALIFAVSAGRTAV